MNILQSAYRTIDAVRNETDSAIVFCSMGKDSIVTLDLVYSRFERVVCVFMYFVPGLEHIERWVRWIKARYPRVEMLQVPHWNLSYILRAGMYSVPKPKIKLIKLADVIKAIRIKTGIHYVFLGMKRSDGMNRLLMLDGYRETHHINKGLAYPLAEWTQKQVEAYMRQHRIPQTVRYGMKASSGVGFNLECFLWLRENFPQDLQRIYNAFPMSQRILFEYDHQQK